MQSYKYTIPYVPPLEKDVVLHFYELEGCFVLSFTYNWSGVLGDKSLKVANVLFSAFTLTPAWKDVWFFIFTSTQRCLCQVYPKLIQWFLRKEKENDF